MKLKKILCSVLTVALLLATFIAFLPAKEVSAANSPSVSQGTEYTAEQIKNELLGGSKVTDSDGELVSVGTYYYTFSSADEMLEYELSKGYLDSVSSPGKLYTLYINRYTGYAYYVNNTTGEILTSNPYNLGTVGGESSINTRKELASQISINFSEVALQSANQKYNSAVWAAEFGQISITSIANGLRVNYTLGDTSTRFAAPEQLSAEAFEGEFIPLIAEKIAEVVDSVKGNKVLYEKKPGADGDTIFQTNFMENEDYPVKDSKNLQSFIFALQDVYPQAITNKKITSVITPVMTFIVEYNPQTVDGKAIYALTDSASRKNIAEFIKTLNPDYSIADAYDHEEEVGYRYNYVQKPVFRCSLEYSFNNDGSLSVRLPATSIVFDETVYTLKSITPLQYFGCGNLNTDGYVFIPDGSGAVIEYEDFYFAGSDRTSIAVNLALDVYGTDYCYSNITGAHKEQVTMPVYGIVSGISATDKTEALTGKSTVTGGFFAILEEGASLARLNTNFGAGIHPYASAFSSFTPYPSDQFDLTGNLSVGGGSSYTMVSESKYTGSYVTRYVMLSDDAANAAVGNAYTPASYTGMAAYYRNYLKETGVLNSIEQTYSDLPLYIEALGSMEIIEKILTFPVTKDIALTTFDDIIEMYDAFSNAKNTLLEKAEEVEAEAESIVDDNELRDSYLARAEEYRNLAENVSNIININFKLTGFANGGMYYTYPSKVKWDKIVGGKDGFNNLVSVSNSKTNGDSVFGVYPEFDFQYINNTKLFDGIGKRGNVARQVDNRYASKQEYNSVIAEFESVFALVISSDALDRLYSKFDKKYSEYGHDYISVSTLGSDLNSNFDEDNSINREQALESVVALLDRISNDSQYNIMVNKGNIYAIEYADHIIDICTDSSHFNYSSYTVPFIGMVLHGHVNYAGSAMNYSGSPDYDLLRAIENGASLYYILCYRNTNHMKDDETLSKYYGVNYEHWYDSIVETYSKLNMAIGDLQNYEIVGHTTLIAERVIDSGEVAVNNGLIMDEFLNAVESQLVADINAAYDEMFGDPDNYGRFVKATVDTEALINIAIDKLNLSREYLDECGFIARLEAMANKYETEYPGISADGKTPYVVELNSVSYESAYEYVTDSFATDSDYDFTRYTVDNNLVVLVTYRNAEGDTVRFILNYNIYSVTVRLDAESEPITLAKNGYIRLD